MIEELATSGGVPTLQHITEVPIEVEVTPKPIAREVSGETMEMRTLESSVVTSEPEGPEVEAVMHISVVTGEAMSGLTTPIVVPVGGEGSTQPPVVIMLGEDGAPTTTTHLAGKGAVPKESNPKSEADVDEGSMKHIRIE